MTRTLDRPGFVNARDLQGVPTERGPVQARRLFRSAAPAGDPAAVLGALHAEGITTVLDLRSDLEVTRAPSIVADEPFYFRAPLVDPRMGPISDEDLDKPLVFDYKQSLDRNGRTIVTGLETVADAADGGVLIHCMAGKDRTGILVALILSLVGAPEEAIVADYAETERHLKDYFAAELESIDDPVRRRRIAHRQHSSPDTMEGMLDHLHASHGGASAYLRANGLADERQRRVVARLTE